MVDKMSDKFYDKLLAANTEYSLISSGDKILVALSGGADSVALLISLREYFPDVELYACHVNHMLRGKDADNDCDFCDKLCQKLGIPFEYLKVDVNANAKANNISTELAARNIRYNYFAQVCHKFGIKKVATAHTLTDNAETVLYNLTRGTSLSGLSGIPPKRALEFDILLIRPLIFATRDDVENYLFERNQNFVTDKTNLGDEYTRNYFRHHVIPVIKQINPSFEENLKNTCVSLRETNDYIKKQTDLNSTDNINLLSTYDAALLKNIVVNEYKKSTGATLIESVHVNKIVELINKAAASPESNFEVCLPGSVSAIIENGKLLFSKTVRKEKEQIISSVPTKLNIGLNYIKNSDFVICVCKVDEIVAPLDNYKLFDNVNIFLNNTDVLYVRFRNHGDKIKTGNHTKKLKELFIHSKIPTESRCKIPLICDCEEILYVPGVALSDNCKSEKSNIRILVYLKTT